MTARKKKRAVKRKVVSSARPKTARARKTSGTANAIIRGSKSARRPAAPKRPAPKKRGRAPSLPPVKAPPRLRRKRVDPVRSAAAKKGWRTRRRKAALGLPSRDPRFLRQRERELRAIERRPKVRALESKPLRHLNKVKDFFFRRMNRLGMVPDEIWRIYYGR